MEPLFSFGFNCKDIRSTLATLNGYELYNKIIDPASNLVQETKILRKVYSYSEESYRNMKATLPFFTCSKFEPAFRKYENFLQASGWIIDIDLKEKNEILTKQLGQDNRVFMHYTSPNGYGIKVIFLFAQPYENKISYAAAYKDFAREFGLAYDVLSYIDMKNCDVSRISFLCHDPDCYYNPYSMPISLSIPEKTAIVTPLKADDSQYIPSNTYKRILTLLDTAPRKEKTAPYVPDRLVSKLEGLILFLQSHDINITNTEKVQYGIKYKATFLKEHGEVIVYTGKKGISIVTSGRRGLSHDLNEVLKRLISHYLLYEL